MLCLYFLFYFHRLLHDVWMNAMRTLLSDINGAQREHSYTPVSTTPSGGNDQNGKQRENRNTHTQAQT